jgi:hypothetical protein
MMQAGRYVASFELHVSIIRASTYGLKVRTLNCVIIIFILPALEALIAYRSEAAHGRRDCRSA